MISKLTLRGILAGTVLILVAAATLGALMPSYGAEAQEAAAQGSMHVSGTAVVSGAPDIAYVSLGVETRSQSAQQAAAENADLMAKVMNALKQLGLTEDDLSTSGYNVYSYQQTPRSDTQAEPITFYVVQNRLEITMRDLEAVGEIIDAAIGAGANQIQSVRFDIQDKQAMQLQALENAIKQARMKAEAMAKAAGVTLGGIKVITEQNTAYVPYTDTAALRAFAVPEAKTQITPGDVEVSADVRVEFWF
ncbi:MAG: SIMPL domain-containing protein [Firmicutes bacterium]|nr:SIMPL domain-containing protein [Bacillota bacterium]